MGRQWRQRPIACQSCRRRKIRCSRIFPCSNCTSRGLRCVQFYEPQEPEIDSAQGGRGAASAEAKPASVTEFQSRLDRLETWIAGLGAQKASSADNVNADGSPPLHDAKTASALPPSTVQHLSEDAVWFGGSFLAKKPKCIQPDTGPFDIPILYHISPIRQIRKPYSIVQHGASTMPSASEICLTLPLYQEACMILHAFNEVSTLLAPIFDLQLLQNTIQGIYASIQQRVPVKREDLFLFLSVISTATFACSAEDPISTLYSSHSEANVQCSEWVSASFMLSDESARRDQASMLCLQAQCILFKVSCYMEGTSVRNRSLLSTSIALARDLGIHKIDSPGHHSRVSTWSAREKEIARRLWWDFVMVDWYMAMFPGPSQGVYTVHPNHMAVNKPSDIPQDGFSGDVELAGIERGGDIGDVSCFLQTIRLAELSREYLDRCPLSLTDTTDRNYLQMLQFDSELQQYRRELPPCFSLDASKRRNPAMETQESASIIVQRIQLNSVLYMIRCILPLRYMALSCVDPRYAPCRQTCFTCATDIVRMHRDVKSEYPWIVSRLNATTFVRTIILASAVFLLDICTGTEISDLKEERPDMLDAWQMMSEMQEDSNLIEQFFDFAMLMLHKYGVSEAVVADLAQQRGAKQDSSMSGGENFANTCVPYQSQEGNTPEAAPTDMGQRWQALDADFDLKTMSWDNMLWGLDTVLM